jgi:hypothetical protein
VAVATWQEVAVALGRPTSDFNADQQAQIAWWLDGVELFIVSRLGLVAELDAATVKYVEVEAVAAKVGRSSSGGASSITVNVDDGGVTRRFESPVTAGDITDEWWTLLDPTISAGAYSVRPGFEPDATSDILDSWT